MKKLKWDLTGTYLTKTKMDVMMSYMTQEELYKMQNLRNQVLMDWKADRAERTAGETAVAELMFNFGYLAAHAENEAKDGY